MTQITPLMIKRLRATGMGYYDIQNDVYGKSTTLTDDQARNVLTFVLDPTALPQPMFTGDDKEFAPEHLKDTGWAALRVDPNLNRIGYRGTIYGDGIHGTDEICGELSEGI